jgi:hypothetical protein
VREYQHDKRKQQQADSSRSTHFVPFARSFFIILLARYGGKLTGTNLSGESIEYGRTATQPSSSFEKLTIGFYLYNSRDNAACAGNKFNPLKQSATSLSIEFPFWTSGGYGHRAVLSVMGVFTLGRKSSPET